MQALLEYFWRLLPANPILLRVVAMASARRRDMFIRCAYLGLLIVVVFFYLLSEAGDVANMSLIDLASASGGLFKSLSYMQLGLVTLLAPVFTAGAITQEKDSQTYDILLSTPLNNGQIVLGSLLSRLFFVVSLLLSGLPVFYLITQLFGGVAVSSIFLSFAISAATAFITGSIAMAIATFKVGTRRTIFSFYLFIVAYMAGIYMADQLDFFRVQLTDGRLSQTSILTGLHPFLALRSVFFDQTYLPPTIDQLPPFWRGWPWSTLITSPSTFFVGLMFTLSTLLVLPSIVLLRKMAQSSLTFMGWLKQKIHLSSGSQNRKPRVVWTNPIAWREAKTKASASRASILRYGFMGLGVVGAIVLLVGHSQVDLSQSHIQYYDSEHNTLTINDPSAGAPKTRRIAPYAQIMLNGNSAPRTVLSRNYRVNSFDATDNGTQITRLILSSVPRTISDADTRKILFSIILVEIAVILLIVTNASASTVTREREDGSLDILLATPITSRYYIWGKLRGLVSFAIPLIAIPTFSCLLFVIADLFQGNLGNDRQNDWVILPESILLLPVMLIGFTALATMLGMHMSLRLRKTTLAVMSAVVIVAGALAAMSACGVAFMEHNSNVMSPVLAAFSPFTMLQLLTDPDTFLTRALQDSALGDLRVALVVSWLFASGINTLIIWGLYKSMVKNFDMTIRRQAR